MHNYCDHDRLATLAGKGGVLCFVIERGNFLYRGMIVLSRLEDGRRTRIVCIKRYQYKEV
jgi:hypothetical protein